MGRGNLRQQPPCGVLGTVPAVQPRSPQVWAGPSPSLQSCHSLLRLGTVLGTKPLSFLRVFTATFRYMFLLGLRSYATFSSFSACVGHSGSRSMSRRPAKLG